MVLTHSALVRCRTRGGKRPTMPSTNVADPGTLSDPDSYRRPAGVHSLWRLRSYLRPYYLALGFMAATALLGVFVSLGIPLVIKAMIDGPIADHDSSAIIPLGLLALALGVVEAALILVRRWVQAAAVL